MDNGYYGNIYVTGWASNLFEIFVASAYHPFAAHHKIVVFWNLELVEITLELGIIQNENEAIWPGFLGHVGRLKWVCLVEAFLPC